ncbi:thermoresistant glucokinase family carbohydrate kinase [Colletotrichum abscissum]|uniref:Gluconokinase n=1 Tax=Colletotrichum abscissum TaxID=1671311 RepID=A0A9P9XJK1_9PEZI|nr:thermoresistant glucokinase family carbohydrate kinase [Colletotrichum abscissum]KAI3555068.1 thermoresistant glucokinase family carbohydrate kinase [Colletotrichum abscissum]KAK1493352.1 thermoresistant glucokinase family carbohydrate kinase [Colletotrichum abscissum]
MSRPKQHIVFLTGPTGTGKTTIAKYLTDSLRMTFIEGDDVCAPPPSILPQMNRQLYYHPKENVEKMHRGEALTDDDRWGWLDALRDEALKELERDHQGVIVTCSALKRAYRDVLRGASHPEKDIFVHFVTLHAPEEVLFERVKNRHGHFAGSNLVHSQFQSLDPPQADEPDVVGVDVQPPVDEVKRDALEKLKGLLSR